MTKRSERLQGFLLAIVLAIGAGVAWGLACALCFSVVIEVVLPRDDVVYRYIAVQDDGTPAIASISRDGASIYRRLDGTQVKRSARSAAMANLYGPPRQERWSGDLGWPNRIMKLSSDWFFVHDGKLHGHGYFVGYDDRTHLLAGYMGRSGFRSDEPPADDQFGVDGHRPAWAVIPHLPYGAASKDEPGFDSENEHRRFPCLLTDVGVMKVDLNNRTLKVLWKDADVISAAEGRKLKPPTHGSTNIDATPIILVRTTDRVVVLDTSGKLIQSYDLPPEVRKSDFQCLQLADDKALVQNGGDLYWLEAGGKVVRHEHVELGRERSAARTTAEDTVLPSLAVPSPGAIVANLAFKAWESGYPAEAMKQALARFWDLLAITSAISIVLAVLCYCRQRKYGLTWTPVWTVFVLLFGLPAFFGYLAHRTWPARLACPHCGRLALRDRPACTACGRDFPAPVAKGIEVFA